MSLVPQANWDQLEVSLQDMSLDSIWEIFIQVLKSAAEKAIPQQQVGGEPRPPKKEVPLNCGIRLLGHILQYITTPSNFALTQHQVQ